MFGIGGFELFIILVFGFLIFGPDKLPDIARTVGKGIARFREAQKEVNDAIGDEKIIDLDNPDEPFKDPIEALDRIAKRQEEKKAGAAGAQVPTAKKPDASKAGGADGAAEGEPRQESFTERKARYERERAARKAAEAEAAKAKADAGSEGHVGSQAPAPAAEEPAAPAILGEATETAPPAILGEEAEGSEAEGSRPLPDRSVESPVEGGDA